VAAATVNPVPDFPDFLTYYGVQLADIGDDGDIIVLGHHDKRLVLAALNRHARRFWGVTNLFDGAPPGPDVYDTIRQTWAAKLTRCPDAEQPNHNAVCHRCSQIRSTVADGSWWIEADVPADFPGAFPAMYWSR
jgi:hypothetical protein